MKNRDSSGLNISEKIAIVTGASSGLGLEITKKLIQQNWIVFGVSKTKKHWQSALSQIKHKDRIQLFRCDVSREKEVKRFFSMFRKKVNRFDLLVNNAGYVSPLRYLEEIPYREFAENINHNLFSVYLMCKYAMPIFSKSEKKGLIINISSMAGKRAVPKLAPYSASKFGVVALSQAIAKEKENKLNCITVCPGGINTEMRANLFGTDDSRKQQSAEFVAGVILDVINEKIQVASGGDIVIRHGKITSINAAPI